MNKAIQLFLPVNIDPDSLKAPVYFHDPGLFRTCKYLGAVSQGTHLCVNIQQVPQDPSKPDGKMLSDVETMAN